MRANCNLIIRSSSARKGVALLKKSEELKKGSATKRDEKANETGEKAKSSLMRALKTGSWNICPECGYRTQDLELTFCMHCGKKLAGAPQTRSSA